MAKARSGSLSVLEAGRQLIAAEPGPGTRGRWKLSDEQILDAVADRLHDRGFALQLMRVAGAAARHDPRLRAELLEHAKNSRRGRPPTPLATLHLWADSYRHLQRLGMSRKDCLKWFESLAPGLSEDRIRDRITQALAACPEPVDGS